MIDIGKLEPIVEKAKQAAIGYYELTGKPLGITGEYGEYLAAKLLGLELADARSPGYDAIDTEGRKFQIKARSIPRGKVLGGQKVSSIRFNHDWDCVVLIVLDEQFEPQAIFEADRKPLEDALTEPGSKARNERGSLSVSKFRSIGRLIWSPEQPS